MSICVHMFDTLLLNLKSNMPYQWSKRKQFQRDVISTLSGDQKKQLFLFMFHDQTYKNITISALFENCKYEISQLSIDLNIKLSDFDYSIISKSLKNRRRFSEICIMYSTIEREECAIDLYAFGFKTVQIAGVFSVTVDDVNSLLIQRDIKRCPTCKLVKPRDMFYHFTNNISSDCKSCDYTKRHSLERQEYKKKYNEEYSTRDYVIDRNRRNMKCEYSPEYRKTENSKTAHLKYNKTNKAKLVRTKYNTSDKGKATRRLIDIKRDSIPRLKIRHRFSSLMNHSLKAYSKTSKCDSSCFELLDYAIDDLVLHLSSFFDSARIHPEHGKMTLLNYGLWHIDHIRPVASFKNIHSTSCDEFRECWSLNNLQPLWAEDNWQKGNQYPFNSFNA